MTSLSNQEAMALLRPLNAGLKLITFRLEVLMLSLLTCGLFAWACYDPALPRILAASLFGLFSLAVMRFTHQPTQVIYAQDQLSAQ